MFSTPDGKTYETEAEYRDALVCYEWEAGRAERSRKLAEGREARMAARLQVSAVGNWDATYPAHMRQRHNLRGR